MTKHLKIYLDGSGFDEGDFIPCEVCEGQAVDIHHIDSRGMGGSHSKDEFSNLMAVCRSCHIKYGDITEFKWHLKQIHFRRFHKELGHLIESIAS